MNTTEYFSEINAVLSAIKTERLAYVYKVGQPAQDFTEQTEIFKELDRRMEDITKDLDTLSDRPFNRHKANFMTCLEVYEQIISIYESVHVPTEFNALILGYGLLFNKLSKYFGIKPDKKPKNRDFFDFLTASGRQNFDSILSVITPLLCGRTGVEVAKVLNALQDSNYLNVGSGDMSMLIKALNSSFNCTIKSKQVINANFNFRGSTGKMLKEQYTHIIQQLP
ncbi:MAG: hypothetical protein RR391_17705 [Chryseobacterium sp.]